MLATLRILGWLACAAYATIPGYWLLIHPWASYWRAHRSPYRVIIPLWLLMMIVSAGVTAPWRSATFYQNAWMWIPAAGLFAVGFWLYQSGGANFNRKQLQGIPELRAETPEQRLVTTGIRARVRHPIYLGHLCEMAAWSVGTGLVACFALMLLAIVVGGFMIRAEDAELERRFGEEYRVYRKSVPAVLPRLGRA